MNLVHNIYSGIVHLKSQPHLHMSYSSADPVYVFCHFYNTSLASRHKESHKKRALYVQENIVLWSLRDQ